ncbi:hypothetical protein C4J81_14375 [Deltaproteobacteria bacterium Smac51]|nr:hypothetical protein C4J81_14375 [Deltaproteobacteria bacterium Smac51]
MRLTVWAAVSFIVAAAMLAALVFMGLVLNSQLKNHLALEKKTELAQAADNLSRLAARDYDARADRARMDDWAKEMGELGKYRVSLIDEEGRLYADSLVPNKELDGTDDHGRRPEVAQAFKEGRGESLRFSTTIGQQYLYAASLVNYQGAPRVLRVGTSLASLDAVRYGFLKFYALTALAGLALALAAVWAGSRRLAASFRNIVETAREMAEGRLDRRADRRAPGELGQVARAINHLADKLSRQLAETEENLNQLMAVLESMSDGVMVMDGEGRIVRTNRRSEEMLGLYPSGPGRVDALRYPELAADCEEVLAGKAAPPRLLHQLGPPERYIEARFSRVGGEAGEAVAVFHDLTEHQQLYQMRRDFVANVSHELRTPLTAIMGAVEAMRQEADSENLQPLLAILERQTGRLHELARDVLALARLERDTKSSEFEQTTVTDIFQAAVASRQADCGNRFTVEIPDGTPPLPIDRAAIGGAIDNLIDNAIKYGLPETKITLRAGFDENFIRLEVENQGPPIALEERARIFERFYRGERSRCQGVGGTGLGLAIVKHVALNHGGEALVDCSKQGRVAFILKLPRQSPAGDAH